MEGDGLWILKLCDQGAFAIDICNVVDNGNSDDSLVGFERGRISPHFGDAEHFLRRFNN